MSSDLSYAEKSTENRVESFQKKFERKARIKLLFDGLAYPLYISEDENYSIIEPVDKILKEGINDAVRILNMDEQTSYSFRRDAFKVVISSALVASSVLHERVRDDEIRAVLDYAFHYAGEHFPDEAKESGFWSNVLEQV